MKIIPKIIITIVTLSIVSSCIQSVKRKIGSCYIQEGEEIKYLKRNLSGDLDTFLLKDANPAFFEIVYDDIPGEECVNGSIWSKDKSNVWFKDRIIKGADPETFTVLENGYAKDKQYAFFEDILLTGSNVFNFQVLSYFYAKDNDMVWYQGNEVFGISKCLNFEVLDGYFSKDEFNVYFNNDTLMMKLPDSDVKTFSCFENNENLLKNSLKYYIDKDNVYVVDTEKNINDKDFLVVFEVFTESFKVFPQKYYSKDNYNIYYKNQIIDNVNHESFKPLKHNYSIDKSNIYFKNKKLHGVDYKTFKVFEDSTDFDSRDKLSYFLKGKKVRVNN